MKQYWEDARMVIWLYFFASVVYFYLLFFFGSFTNLKMQAKRVLMSTLFVLMISSFSGVIIHSTASTEFSKSWFYWTNFLMHLFPAMIMHFVFSFTGKKPSRKFFVLVYTPAIILMGAELYQPLQRVTGFLYRDGFNKILFSEEGIKPMFYVPYLYLYVAPSLNILYDFAKKSSAYRERRIAQILSGIGFLIFVMAGAGVVYFTRKGFYMGMLPVSVLLWFLSVWFFVVRYRFSMITSADAAEAILERVKDLILLVDQDGTIINANQRFYEILGYTKKDVIGINFENFIDDKQKVQHRFRRKSDKNTQDEYVFETNYIAKEQQRIPVRIAISVVKDKLGDLIGIVVVGQDVRITKLLQSEIEYKQKTEQELVSSYERLKEVDQMKTDFITMISHELRTPLTSIIGFTKIAQKKLKQQLKKEQVSENSKESIQGIIENLSIVSDEGVRLTNLINDVLDIAKMEAGKIEWKMKKVDLKEWIERAFEVTNTLIQEKDIRVHLNIEPNLPQIEIDPERILQVMINLISNAIKFTERGTIQCFVKSYQQGIRVSIKDSGMGILQEDLKVIFEKFKQVGDTLTSKPNGTGLGLPICKQIIEYHGGQIGVSSKPGEGSTFYFTLPFNDKPIESRKIRVDNLSEITDEALNDEPSHIESMDGVMKSPFKEKKRIYILDPMINNTDVLQVLIRQEAFAVVEFETKTKLMEEIAKQQPHLIVLEVNFSDGNGFELTKELKNNEMYSRIPIIILSDVEDLAKGFLAGVDRYITKPVDSDEFSKEVEYLMNKGLERENVLLISENEYVIFKVVEGLRQRGYRNIFVSNQEQAESKAIKYLPQIIIYEEGYMEKEAMNRMKKHRGLENSRSFVLEGSSGI